MNYRTILLIFFFGWIGLTTTSFAQDPTELIVFKGGDKPFQIPGGFGEPSRTFDPNEGNVILEFGKTGNDWHYKYVPDPSFEGSDGFTYEVIHVTPSGIEVEEFVFQIQVVESEVYSNDDFVHLTSDDEIVINVLSNDEATSTDLTVSIAQVVKGTAVVNEDQTISYTPSAEDVSPDFIIYTVKDEVNTISTSTVYLTQEDVPTEELTVREYTIASGNSQYIILPNDDYTLNQEEYGMGSVEQVNTFVYEYSSNNDASGQELVNFTDSNDNGYQASIKVFEKYYDEGYVRDDVFYSAANTSIKFDVTLNDTDDQYVIADYSDELYHHGQGVFTFTPLPYFTGVKTFFYTADDGFTEETGTIEVVFNNYKPTNFFEYSLATPENQPRIIEYDVPLGTEYFEIAALPTHGSVEIFTEDESVDIGCEEGLQKVFVVYTPDTDYVGVDDLTIRYCASDNNICNDVNIALDVVESDVEDCICVDDCVWPGDANGDGKVSITDALSIGRFIGSGGAEREESPFGATYEGVSVEDWIDTQVNGKNIKHADTNGDGVITVDDLDVIVDNYGDVNSIISNDVLGIKNLPFLLSTTVTEVDSGDLLEIFVTLGSVAYPAIDIQGVAFAINLPATLVDSSTVKVEYLESGYLVKDAPYVGLTHQPIDGIIHTAGLKTNSIGSTGSGLIAVASFIVEENAEGFKDENKRSTSSQLEDVIATITATDIVVEDSRGYKYALPNSSLDIVVKSGKEANASLEKVSVYPNPTGDMVTVSSDNGALINTINIYSTEGRLIKSINQLNTRETQLDVSGFENGLYIIEALGKENTFTTKLIKN